MKYKIDDADLDWIRAAGWTLELHSKGAGRAKYVRCSRTINGKRERCYLHRLLLGEIPDGHEVDHINGDPLDNRRENLRSVERRVNAQNRRNNAGGLDLRANGQWRVRIHLGTRASRDEAERLLDRALDVLAREGLIGSHEPPVSRGGF